jgi:hypothetical protein
MIWTRPTPEGRLMDDPPLYKKLSDLIGVQYLSKYEGKVSKFEKKKLVFEGIIDN